MNYSYKQNKKGKAIAWILVLVLLIAAAGAVFVAFNKKENKPTVEPEATTNLQEGLVMSEKASFRFKDSLGLTFTMEISPEMYEEVSKDENKTFGIVIGPIKYFRQVDTGEGFDKIDWIKEFEEKELNVSCLEGDVLAVTAEDGTLSHYILNGSIVNVPYQGVNTRIVGFGYLKTVDGENVSYKYAALPEGVSYEDYACAYMYAAADLLNEIEVLDLYMAQSDIDILKSVINQAVDLAHGLEAPTDDGSTFSVTLSEVAKDLKIGEEFILDVEIAEPVRMSIWWQSTDTSVAVVKDGVIKAVGEGSATINVFVAGEKYTCEITVGNGMELPNSVE